MKVKVSIGIGRGLIIEGDNLSQLSAQYVDTWATYSAVCGDVWLG